MKNKLGCWQGKMLDMGTRVLLINACLSSIPLYMLSFYRLPMGVHKIFSIYRSRFLWQEEQGVRKYHLVDWGTVCTPKDLGGLGVLNLDLMNIGLLCKWLWKLENETGMWQDILKKKYLQKETMTQIEEKPGVSQFWSGLVKVKEVFYRFCKRIVVSGNKTRFWEDMWHDGKSLSEAFPRLFNLSMNHNITVQKVVSSFGGVSDF
jgi:hypothetical protein